MRVLNLQRTLTAVVRPQLRLQARRTRHLTSDDTDYDNSELAAEVFVGAGVFYLLTFVSIPTLALYKSVRGPGFVAGPGPDTPVVVGALLEMIVALAGIGTAVALYPVVRRQGQARAVGFVASRVLEAATIYVGIISLMSIVTPSGASERRR